MGFLMGFLKGVEKWMYPPVSKHDKLEKKIRMEKVSREHEL